MPKKLYNPCPISDVPSPYTSPTYIVRIGSNNISYRISRSFLPQSLVSLASYDGTIALPKVDENVGHTLIHYLHALVYQTLGNNESTPETEYRRSVLVYSTAVKYGIEGLATIAKQQMEEHDGLVTVFDMVAACRDAYKNSPENDPWLLTYLQAKLAAALEEDETVFCQDRFLDQVGGPEEFSRMIFQTVVGIYAGKRSTRPDPVLEAEPVPEPDMIHDEEKLAEWHLE